MPAMTQSSLQPKLACFPGGRLAVTQFATNMSGGTNSSVSSGGGDTLQIGNSGTPINQTFTAQANDGGSFATIVGMEILNFFTSGTIFRGVCGDVSAIFIYNR